MDASYNADMVKGVVEEGGTDYNVLIWIIMFQVT